MKNETQGVEDPMQGGSGCHVCPGFPHSIPCSDEIKKIWQGISALQPLIVQF
jgi:hypothetical protein